MSHVWAGKEDLPSRSRRTPKLLAFFLALCLLEFAFFCIIEYMCREGEFIDS